MTAATPVTVLRSRSGQGHHRVTFVELFYDLVFVFAITQLSHLLLDDFSLRGGFQVLLLTLAVWWVWIDTSWVTNWLDPEHLAVRLMLFTLMLAGLVMSSAIPQAFEEKGLLFAGAYAATQVGRSCFTMLCLRGRSPANHLNFQRITIWLTVSGLLWVAGGFAAGELRIGIWLLALALDCAAPIVGFVVPGLGRSTTADWDVEGGHFSERCGLFVIIALGESILVTGATFARLDPTLETMAAIVSAFVGSVAMWWIYFDVGAERGTERIASSADPGRLARLAYTYLHVPIVAGIIVVAAADEFVLAHPGGHTSTETLVATVAGTALYLCGNLSFKWATAGWPPLSHLVGLGLLLPCIGLGSVASPLVLSAATTAILVLVAVWEATSIGRRTA